MQIRQELYQVFSEIVEKVISVHFWNERDKTLIKVFRSYANFLADLWSNRMKQEEGLSEEQVFEYLIADAESAQSKYEAGKDFALFIFNKYPKFDLESNANKLLKFFMVFNSYDSKFFIPDEERLTIWKAELHGINQYLLLENDTEVTDFAKPLVEYRNAEIKLLEEKIAKKKNKAIRSNLEFWDYGEDALLRLEASLMSRNLIDEDSALIPPFSAKEKKSYNKVNWTGEMRSLIYLIYCIAQQQKKIHGISIFKFCAERFKLNGSNISAKQLSTSLSKVMNAYLLASAKQTKPDSIKMIDEIIPFIFPK